MNSARKAQSSKHLISNKTDPLKLVLRGLPRCTPLEKVQKQIDYAGFKAHKITRLSKFRTKAPMPLIYVQIVNNPQAEQIYSFTEMFNAVISFEAVKAKFRNAFVARAFFILQTPVNCPTDANDRVRLGQRATGGTAIYIKNHFDHNSIPTPDLDFLDATIIEIKIGNIPPIKIISACIKLNLRGGFPLEDFKKLLNSGQNVIIAGDLNAIHINWNNYNCNPYGRKFFNFISKVEGVRVIAPHSPTHLNHSSRDTVLDICIQKRIPFNSEIHVLNKLNSDHLPVTLAINTGSFAINSPELFSTNWENFRHILNSKPLPPFQIKSDDHIESAVGTLGNFFKET
ncbi:hypothetical protein AVEN_260063-1 [Araneus ventricosus]|uniref:Endonuclease/exonuclease/phosphatase domain-containing protein n=1 Tax=Araneus ventricosus TaxID=182803 RepID=A0A4Y2G789_ARAVE|nr:hypothetical protein AVEN_260063-1 [Araneus ventricosus]